MKLPAKIDYVFLRHMTEQIFSKINHVYFRAKVLNHEKIENRKKKLRIYFSNHSGMAFPWDGIVFNTLLWEKNNFEQGGFPRPLIHPMLTQNRINNPYLIEDFWHRAGCVDATLENFEALLQDNQDVLIFPEGVEGIGKGFEKRYQIQKFSTSFLRLAHRYDAELVPVYTVNGEFLHPWAYKNDKLNHFVQKFGLPFFPISPFSPLAGIYPWMYYFSFPAKMHFVFGEPILPSERFSSSHSMLPRSEYIRIRDEVQEDFQFHLNQNVSLYGDDPFNFKELFDKLKLLPEMSLYLIPFNWPILMTALVKEFEKGNLLELKFSAGELLRITLKHLDAYAFTLPFSWLPILSQKDYSFLDLWKGIAKWLEEELHLNGKEQSHGLHKVHGLLAEEKDR